MFTVKYLIYYTQKCPLHYIPPAKLCYVPMTLDWLAS